MKTKRQVTGHTSIAGVHDKTEDEAELLVEGLHTATTAMPSKAASLHMSASSVIFCMLQKLKKIAPISAPKGQWR